MRFRLCGIPADSLRSERIPPVATAGSKCVRRLIFSTSGVRSAMLSYHICPESLAVSRKPGERSSGNQRQCDEDPVFRKGTGPPGTDYRKMHFSEMSGTNWRGTGCMNLSSLPSAGHSPRFFLQSVNLLALPCTQTGSTADRRCRPLRSGGADGRPAPQRSRPERP